MTDNQILELIQKLIDKTKLNKIYWRRCQNSDFALKPLRKLATETVIYNFELTSTKIDLSNSYVCKINNGYFFLIFIPSILSGDIYLYSQTDDSEFSRVYASTEALDDVQIISQLKRLYNIVDVSLSNAPIDAFIEDFLTNE